MPVFATADRRLHSLVTIGGGVLAARYNDGSLYGAFCVGCCWFLMGLMFFGGVMNLYWTAGLALFVLCEKTVPAGHWLDYATGLALLVWGAGMLSLAF